MDRFSVMKAYCRIVERGSISRAAEDLGVSPALLSRELKLLEEGLDCTLLSRTTRSMSLTEHGRLYYAEARRILEDIERTEDRLRAGAGTVRGPLRINAPHSYGTVVLSKRLPEFLELYPEVEVTLDFDDHVVDMIEGGFDLSIRIRAGLPDSGLVARKIAPVRQRLFGAPGYLASHGAPSKPDDLMAHVAIGYLLSDTPETWNLAGADGAATVQIAPRHWVGSSVALRDMLIAGLGIGALPDFISDQAEKTGQLARVLPDWELPERYIYAVTASRLGADARTLAFIEFLARSLR